MPFLDETGLKRVWSKVLDKTHPVGSLYWSSNSTNPGTLFGGTWVQIKDKFILAAGDTYKNGATGGSADAVVVSHTHSIPALSGSTNKTGNHIHNLYDYNNGTRYGHGSVLAAGSNAWAIVANPGASNTIVAQGAGDHTHTVTTKASTTGYQGVSGAGKNMPPYETYYCWKRTA